MNAKFQTLYFLNINQILVPIKIPTARTMIIGTMI